MVVPEQRHLFLEGTLRVHHPEQPSLTSVDDVSVGRERARRCRADVVGLPGFRIHVVRLALVFDEVLDEVRNRRSLESGDVSGTGAKPCASEHVGNVVRQSCHLLYPEDIAAAYRSPWSVCLL